MKKETYLKNKNTFLENYNRHKPDWGGLNIGIDLLMEGIHGKGRFFFYFSYDTGITGSTVVSSIDRFKRYMTYTGSIISRISEPTYKNMFKIENEFERFDEWYNKKIKNKPKNLI